MATKKRTAAKSASNSAPQAATRLGYTPDHAASGLDHNFEAIECRLCSRRRAAVLRVGRLQNPPREPFRSARSAANSPRNRSGSFPTARPSSVLLHFRILLAARSLLANDPVAARHGGGVDRSQHSTDICGVA